MPLLEQREVSLHLPLETLVSPSLLFELLLLLLDGGVELLLLELTLSLELSYLQLHCVVDVLKLDLLS